MGGGRTIWREAKTYQTEAEEKSQKKYEIYINLPEEEFSEWEVE